MPCFDEGYNSSNNVDVSQLVERLNNVTDLLCKADRAYATNTGVPSEVLEWWRLHSQLDFERGEPWFQFKT